MFPLAAVSLLMWTLIAERLITFRRLTRRDVDIQDAGMRQGSPVNHFATDVPHAVAHQYQAPRPALDRQISRVRHPRASLLARNLSVIA
jgi:hypothetical protein